MKLLNLLAGVGLAALVSCSQSDESILAKKAKQEFLRNENKIYQEHKVDKRAKPIGYKIEEIVKSDLIQDLGILNVEWAVENCQVNREVKPYKIDGALEIAWVELAVQCPKGGCYFLDQDYARIEYGFVRDKNNKWCIFMDSFKLNRDYSSLSEEYLKNFKEL